MKRIKDKRALILNFILKMIIFIYIVLFLLFLNSLITQKNKKKEAKNEKNVFAKTSCSESLLHQGVGEIFGENGVGNCKITFKEDL